MRIVIIGTGNTAAVLGKLFLQAGHTIVQVFGRSMQSAESLSQIFNSTFASDAKQLDKVCDLYVVAVSDSGISDITSWLRVDKKLVVHTAGSVEAGVLSVCSTNYGVLYPLQSLRKETDHIPAIPFLVEGNTHDSAALIYDFANSISGDVQFASGEQRLMLHVAGIMVNNFTNHLYALAEDFCKSKHVDFKMLLPLINETATRLDKFSPSEVQTGPAARADSNTIQKHIALLRSYPLHQSVYRLLSESIQRWNLATNYTDLHE